MTFNSLQFLVFFMVVTLWFFRLKSQKGRIWLLLIASCYFYMSFIPEYIVILGGTIVVDYFAGFLIERNEGSMRKFWLITSLIANIGALAVFKYYNFFIENIQDSAGFFGHPLSLPVLKIALPIGLSFHTFQAMSYTIEVYRRNQQVEKEFCGVCIVCAILPATGSGPNRAATECIATIKRIQGL